MMRVRMTPWERFEAAARHEEVDYVPVYVGAPGRNYREGSGVDTMKRYPEAVHLINVGRGVDPTTFGSVLDPRSASLDADWWEPLLQNVTESEKLSVPPREALLPRLLEARDAVLARCPEEVRNHYGGGGWTTAVSGPMDFACRLLGHLGYERILVGFYRHPREVHVLFNVLAQANVEWIRLCLDVLGDVRVLHLADHGLALISPQHFPVFGLPYWRRQSDVMPPGSIIWYHNEGDVTHLMEAVPQMGVDVFEFGWVDIGAAKRRIGDKVCLLGNIDPTTVLLSGTVNDVTNACRDAISVAAPDGGYILSSRGGETPRTPVENIDAVYMSAFRYGSYPSLLARR